MKKILISTIGLLLFFTGCSNLKKDDEIRVVKYNNSKIDLKYTVVNDDSIIIETINNGENVDYASINVAAYNSNNELLGVEKQYLHSLVNGQKNLIKISLNDFISNDDKVSKIELNIKPKKYEKNIEKSFISNIEGKIESTDDKDQIKLTLTNNSEVVIDNLNAAVVFTKNGKMVDIYNVNVQSMDDTYSENIYVPLSENKDGTVSYVDYDDTSIIVNYAISYIE